MLCAKLKCSSFVYLRTGACNLLFIIIIHRSKSYQVVVLPTAPHNTGPPHSSIGGTNKQSIVHSADSSKV